MLIRGRLRKPYAKIRIDTDGTITVRVDDEKDPAFWLEIDIDPTELEAAARKLSEELGSKDLLQVLPPMPDRSRVCEEDEDGEGIGF